MRNGASDREDRIAAGFHTLIWKAVEDFGISAEDIKNLKSVQSLRNQRKAKHGVISTALLFVVVLLLSVAIPIFSHRFLIGTEFGYQVLDKYFSFATGRAALDEFCLIQMPYSTFAAFRPPVNCDECANVEGVHRVTKLSHDEFLERYAFSMQPVIVTDGQTGWTAKDSFSFEFFREVYSEGSRALERATDCQFFPYESEFRNLSAMLNMSRDRVDGTERPWYVGWSNCDGKAANILRRHYEFPYFLPPSLDHSKTDWVFMGLPGYGAPNHIDAVEASSWQAQIKGTKKWILEAPPECYGTCRRRIEVVVEPGDILVLDTNKWFHSTIILGNETSIVIGSEYY